ncbi:MAG: tRNA uridine-5-carboxymethylaminomethyl(34) synthesis GTPase MnmE [Henriciella sp.]|nr:tRNA uridine-5-carboxymethylaminomethyl(34) synthesis GTPase MnmE [Henriciella sp.]
MASSRDTICALATGAPPSAISVLRLSGPSVIDIAGPLLLKGVPPPRITTLDTLQDQAGAVIDTGLMVFMPGPASYTGEDTLELSLHGGRMVTELALKALIDAGARLAEPGEFTRRAFEAGKLDLTRAEAIADLIDAESEAQHSQALKQLDGALANLYGGWRTSLTECLALLEASIDFPDEEDAPQRVDEPVRQRLSDLISELEQALKDGNITERIRDGFKIAILGKPNAGKSTLLNQLSGRDAAIVTEIPGTTRDAIEVRMVIGGYLVWLVDTAGLRDTDDIVEKEGVRRAIRAGDEADIRIFLYDGDDIFEPSHYFRDGDIIAVNKSDIRKSMDVSRETIQISAKTGLGLEVLMERIKSRLTYLGGSSGSPVITRARHRQGIVSGLEALNLAKSALDQGSGAELVAEDVRLASRHLGALTGHVDAESVLGAVFSSFCIGK